MEKRRRNIEENKRISITTIVILVFIFIISIFTLIYILFANSETNKQIESVSNEIESLKYETSLLNDKKEEISELLSNVEDPSIYKNIQIDNYKSSLPSVEDVIKQYDSEEKIAYLAFIDDNGNNLDKVIDTLNENKVLATFFTNNKDDADKIINSGNLIGLYIDDENKVNNIKEEYKDIFDAYNPDLFMVSTNLKEKEINIDSLYQVKDNSSSEGKKLLNQTGYIDDIVETTADRDFLIIRINVSNSIGVSAIDGIISKLKDKNYIFLPIVSTSSLIEK